MRVDIWHNIMWSKYKAGVFSELYRVMQTTPISAQFIQIAESEVNRIALSPVDHAWHKYPYKLLFKGAYSDVPRLRLYWKIAHTTIMSGADLVVLAGYSEIEYWLQLVIAKLMRKRVMTFCDSTMYDRPRNPIKSFLKACFFRMCDGVFCYGVRSGEYIHSFGIPFSRIYTRCQAAALPEGYDRDVALKRRVAEAAGPDAPRFLYVGRLAEEKDLTILLQAFQLVLRELPAARLVIIGSGPEREELAGHVRFLGISASVEFAGNWLGEELAAEYLKATCLVLPSRSEPWGLVVNEALSYGCPVLVSNHCGCVPELVREGATGFVLNCGDVEDFTSKMVRIVAEFTDTEAVAHDCLEQIGQFTPEHAARNILAGIDALVCSQGV